MAQDAVQAASYAAAAYNGRDAIIFVDAGGTRRRFRIRLLPAEGVQPLTAAEAAQQPPDHLMQELQARPARQPVRSRFMAQLARPGDQTQDPTQPWPEDRELVELGTVALTRIAADGTAVAEEAVFMPDTLPDGIEVSDDPLIDARVQSYAVSFGLRSQ